MNNVYLDGEVVTVTEVSHQSAEKRHLVIRLRTSHWTAQGTLKREVYTINAWHMLASWAQTALRPGMKIMVAGYLTQRGGPERPVTEVTASLIHPVMPQEGLDADAPEIFPEAADNR